MKATGYILMLLVVILMGFTAKAQLSVTITADNFSGCSPQNLRFGCNVTGASGNVSYSWSSGNGDVSQLASPTFSYLDGGTYTISVTVTSNGQTASDSHEVVIFQSPEAHFDETPRTGCTPFDVTMNDQSAQGDAPITSWLWYWGDGTTSATQNATHTYLNSGLLTVSLRVTDANGCTDEHYAQISNVSSAPSVSVETDVDQWCQPPLVVPFQSHVTTAPNVSPAYTLSWNFGDGQTGTGDNLTHTYNSYGQFDVSVTVTDSYGCSASASYPSMISIAALVPRYDAPSVVCKNVSATFRSLMPTNTNCQWNFGDGSPVSHDRNAHHTYTTAGTYTVTFTVDPGGPCERTTTFDVTVEHVEASFTVDSTFSCDYPFTVHFTNTSTGDDISYLYDIDVNPPYNTYNTNENPEVTYYENGVYHPTLTAYTSAGCYDTFEGPTIIVNHPEASMALWEGADPVVSGGCNPTTVYFDHFIEYTENEAIVDYYWDFGDGNTMHTTYTPVSHTYTEVGTFYPTLTIVDTSGCTDTRPFWNDGHISGCGCSGEIEIGYTVPPEDYGVYDNTHTQISGDTICPQDVYYLYNSMYASSDSILFTFHINEHNFNPPIPMEYTPYTFDIDTGWNYIGLSTSYLLCPYDDYRQDSVYVMGPIMNFKQYTHCSAPFDFRYTITDNRGAHYWEWIITNSDHDTLLYIPHSISTVLNYTYPDYGSYQCTLIGHKNNSDCTYITNLDSYINELLFEWHLSPDTVCMGRYMSVELDNYAAEFFTIGYNWGVNDVPVEDLEWFDIHTNISHPHMYQEAGNHTITAYLRQNDGCISTYTKPIYVVDPASAINPPPTVVCAPTTIEFECILTNTDDPISDVQWSIGGTDVVHGNNIQHEFTDTGYLNITYMVTTMHGCTDRQTLNNHIHAIAIPDLDVQFDDSVCNTSMVLFSANVVNPDFTYEWDFGSAQPVGIAGSVLSLHFPTPGRYPFSLKVTGGLGCTDSINYPNGVLVEGLETDLTPQNQIFDCYPAQPVFNVTTIALPDGTQPSFHWNMGNGDNLYVENPEYLYNTPGNYQISFEVTTPAGCRQIKNASIIVSGPYANISISDTAICAGDEVTFRMLNAQNVQSYQWVVGGGHNYTMPTVTHTYDYVPQSGYFPVVLSLTSGECSVDITEMIHVYGVDARFGLFANGNEITEGQCGPLDATLINQSSENSGWNWYLNGKPLDVSENEIPIHWTNPSYSDSTFTVSLAVTSDHNCYDSVSHAYLIFPSPHPRTNNDTVICFGNDVNLFVVGGNTYHWESPIDDNSPSQAVTPNETTTYYVEVFTDKMCRAEDSVRVGVITPLEADIDPTYTTINIGDTAVALIMSDMDLNCRWNPETDVISFECDSLIFFPLHTTDYVVWLSDTLGCYESRFDIHIEVDMNLTLDVPGAFTPLSNGDGNNIVYVRGLGIKRLLQFRIYNRWGEEVFFSDDLHIGWDGTLKGKVQNNDTYSYYVEAEMFDGSIRTKKGNLMLIR
ncbi:MAG: PKD domain-containing protein [Bacteroidales bacterium]|nr:PKD domain-containing protein [Bacteroidales bacterium]